MWKQNKQTKQNKIIKKSLRRSEEIRAKEYTKKKVIYLYVLHNSIFEMTSE